MPGVRITPGRGYSRGSIGTCAGSSVDTFTSASGVAWWYLHFMATRPSMHAHLKGTRQAVEVDDADMALVHFEQTPLPESRKGAADALRMYAQVAADFVARHSQVKFAARVAARLQAL